MKVISEKAGLSRKYTNNCLRVTAISVLRRNGIDGSDNWSVSRHKTTDSIRPYCMGPPDKQRYRMSSMLHDHGRNGHRRQACTSHVLLARHKRMSTAVSWHPLLTGSLDLRQWALLKMTRSFSFLAISSSSSRGGGRPGNMTMVESSQGEQNVEEHLCLGCIWDRKCPRV